MDQNTSTRPDIALRALLRGEEDTEGGDDHGVTRSGEPKAAGAHHERAGNATLQTLTRTPTDTDAEPAGTVRMTLGKALTSHLKNGISCSRRGKRGA
jgi:hypothetical protein